MPGSNILDLNGRQLQLFLSIFDHQSLAEAARSLNIDPVNAGTAFDVVRRILEDDLFVRTGRGFEPTEFSLQIEPSVREHLARLESLVAPREFHPADELGRITIAANVTELLDEIVQIRDAIMLDANNITDSAKIAFLDAQDGDVIVFPEGRFDLNDTLTLDGELGGARIAAITICGQGMDKTILDFSNSVGDDGLFITNINDVEVYGLA